MKRFVAFALTCMLLVCMFPALAETAPSTSKLITDEPVTLTVATIDNPYTASPLTPDLPVWKYLEEITGVHIEFETYSADQYVTGRRRGTARHHRYARELQRRLSVRQGRHRHAAQ